MNVPAHTPHFSPFSLRVLPPPGPFTVLDPEIGEGVGEIDRRIMRFAPASRPMAKPAEPVINAPQSCLQIRMLEQYSSICDAAGNVDAVFLKTIIGLMEGGAWMQIKVVGCPTSSAWTHLMNAIHDALRPEGLSHVLANSPGTPYTPSKRLTLKAYPESVGCDARFCVSIDPSVVPAGSEPTPISSLMGEHGPIWDSVR